MGDGVQVLDMMSHTGDSNRPTVQMRTSGEIHSLEAL